MTLDGNNKKITGLMINRPSTDYVGLFGTTNSSPQLTISNLTIEGNIIGASYVGLLTGKRGYITNCRTKGTIKGKFYVGGIGGYYVAVTSCINEATATGTYYIGGIVGYNGRCTQCLNYGDIEGSNYVGGISGYNTTDNCCFTGVVSGQKYVAGISGANSSVYDTKYSYVNANVIGNDNVGGCSINGSSSANLFVAGAIIAKKGDVQRIGGKNIYNCTAFVNAIVAAKGEKPATLDGTNIGATMLKMKTTYTGKGWDFDNTWAIQEGESFPYLQWQTAPPTITSEVKAGATSISGKSIEDTTAYVRVGDKIYSTAVSDGSWTIAVPALLAGELVAAYTKSEDKEYSNWVMTTVAYPGSGTESDPYLVSTVKDLQNMGDGYYRLTNDIEITDDWQPLEHLTANALTFDGNGHTISGLRFAADESFEDAGLFGLGYNTSIKNLKVTMAENTTATGSETTGTLVGLSTNAKIEQVAVCGQNSSDACAGGLIGLMKNGTVSQCKTSGTVSSAKGEAGGIIGQMDASGSISDSYSDATVNGSTYAAGIVAYNYGSVARCYSSGAIEAAGVAAGVVGCNDGTSATIANCYGINPSVKATKSNGTAMRVVGGIPNSAPTPGTDNYALKSMTVTVNGVVQTIYDDPMEGYSKTDAELKQKGTFSTNSWDFGNIWSIAEDYSYPYLSNVEGHIKAPQTVSWTPASTVMKVGESITLAATASSGLPVTYTITSGAECAEIKLSESTYSLHALKKGNVEVTVSQAGNDDYEAAESASITFTIEPKTQTIAWEPSVTTLTIGDSLKLSATASSQLDISYKLADNTSGAEIVEKDGNHYLHALKQGTVTVIAFQSGNDVYAADTMKVNFTINKKKQTISWEQASLKVIIGHKIQLTAEASSGLAVSYQITSGSAYAEIVREGNSYYLKGLALGEVIVSANQSGNSNYEEAPAVTKSFTVCEKLEQTITWEQDIEIVKGTTLTMQAVSSSGLPVTYTYKRPEGAFAIPTSISGSEIVFDSPGAYILYANQEGNDEYEAAEPVKMEFNVLDEAYDDLMYIDGIYYRYADKNKNSLMVVRGYKKYEGDIVVPSYTNALPVVKIDDFAFYASYGITSIVVGDSVTYIGNQSLGVCRYMTSVTLPPICTLVDYAFNCSTSLKEIHCKAASPYSVNETIFNGGVDYTTCILYVPRGKKELYAATEVWKNFVNIVEEDVTTGITHIEDEKSFDVYNLQGYKVLSKAKSLNTLSKGIYIVNGKKIIVR